MYLFKKLTVTIAISALSVALSSELASAGSSNGAASLMPLEPQGLVVESDPTLMESAEQGINGSATPNRESNSVLGIETDEDGDVVLPAGLTVFTVMGSPSVGFKGDL